MAWLKEIVEKINTAANSRRSSRQTESYRNTKQLNVSIEFNGVTPTCFWLVNVFMFCLVSTFEGRLFLFLLNLRQPLDWLSSFFVFYLLRLCYTCKLRSVYKVQYRLLMGFTGGPFPDWAGLIAACIQIMGVARCCWFYTWFIFWKLLQ